LAGETEVLGENLPQRHFCPSQNPTCPPGFEPGPLRWEAGVHIMLVNSELWIPEPDTWRMYAASTICLQEIYLNPEHPASLRIYTSCRYDCLVGERVNDETALFVQDSV
jgi:hypothetical protein